MKQLVVITLLWFSSHMAQANQDITLQVYKSPTCGCCELWLNHLQAQNIHYQATDLDYLGSLKNKYGIRHNYQSCHTAVSKAGFIFEGHVPAKFIKQFLANENLTANEDILGLSVPAMPVGTPGMEIGERFMPYQILLLKKDGSHQVFAEINRYEEQF